MDFMLHKVFKVNKVYKETLVHRVFKVCVVSMLRKVYKVSKVYKVI